MHLSKQQREQLWGEHGPYSDVRMIFQTEMLNTSIACLVVAVEVNLNPLTYEIISKNKKLFADDPMILELIDDANGLPQCWGHLSRPFVKKYSTQAELKEATETQEKAKAAIIKMHAFVMDLLGLK